MFKFCYSFIYVFRVHVCMYACGYVCHMCVCVTASGGQRTTCFVDPVLPSLCGPAVPTQVVWQAPLPTNLSLQLQEQ